MNVIWSPKAIESFNKIVDFLNERWTKKEIDAFADQTDKVIEQITENPYMFVATQKRKNVRKGLVNKLVGNCAVGKLVQIPTSFNNPAFS